MKAGLWIGIGIGIVLALVTAGLIVGGVLLNRQVWAGTAAITPQSGAGWGYPGMPGCGGMGYRYYTIHTQKDGQIVGMLSVHGARSGLVPHLARAVYPDGGGMKVWGRRPKAAAPKSLPV